MSQLSASGGQRIAPSQSPYEIPYAVDSGHWNKHSLCLSPGTWGNTARLPPPVMENCFFRFTDDSLPPFPSFCLGHWAHIFWWYFCKITDLIFLTVEDIFVLECYRGENWKFTLMKVCLCVCVVSLCVYGSIYFSFYLYLSIDNNIYSGKIGIY